MDVEDLRALCLQLPGAVETMPFGPGVWVYKCGAKQKMFALVPCDADPPTISLKCDPDLAVELRREHEAVEPGYHLNKRHWNTVTLGRDVPDGLVAEWVEDSYDLVGGSTTTSSASKPARKAASTSSGSSPRAKRKPR